MTKKYLKIIALALGAFVTIGIAFTYGAAKTPPIAQLDPLFMQQEQWRTWPADVLKNVKNEARLFQSAYLAAAPCGYKIDRIAAIIHAQRLGVRDVAQVGYFSGVTYLEIAENMIWTLVPGMVDGPYERALCRDLQEYADANDLLAK